MPGKDDGITKRKDGRYLGRYTVQTPNGPKRKMIYGRKYKEVEAKLAEARGDAVRGLIYDASDTRKTLSGGSRIAYGTRCARGSTNGTRASFGCI